jgi:hypothetical protein
VPAMSSDKVCDWLDQIYRLVAVTQFVTDVCASMGSSGATN